MSDWQKIKLWCGRLFVATFCLALALYLADWGIWAIRSRHGHGFSSVVVMQLTVAPLKGNREEYYPDSSGPERCSRSIFPQAGALSCWWLERHRVRIDR